MKIYSIETGNFKLDGGAMFGVVPKSIWNKVNPADENNMCSWALRCMLIENGDRLILVDTGMGNKQDEKFFGHYYMHGNATLQTSLEEYGFSFSDITDVVLTHLHFDHCGGAIIRNGDQLQPTFPNASYWSNDLHWQWAVNPNARERASFLKENILPIKESGKLKFIEGIQSNPHDASISQLEKVSSVFDKIDFFIVNGHTRAMMLPRIQYKGRTIVYMADLLPSHGHIPLPYVMAYDMFPLTSLNEKRVFLEEAVANDYVLFFEHDIAHECCTLQKTEKGIRPNKFFKLDEL